MHIYTSYIKPHFKLIFSWIQQLYPGFRALVLPRLSTGMIESGDILDSCLLVSVPSLRYCHSFWQCLHFSDWNIDWIKIMIFISEISILCRNFLVCKSRYKNQNSTSPLFIGIFEKQIKMFLQNISILASHNKFGLRFGTPKSIGSQCSGVIWVDICEK